MSASKLTLSTTFSCVSRFKSTNSVLFWSSLQSKETQNVHQRFSPFLRPETKKSGFRTADPPSESQKYLYFARFLPKMRKETPFIVVDKRRFFFGLSDWNFHSGLYRPNLLKFTTFGDYFRVFLEIKVLSDFFK